MRHDDQPFRVLLYSHDSVGLGHIRRNLALAHALVADSQAFGGRPVTGILLTGVGHEAELDVPAGFDVVLLPGICKGTLGYRPRHVRVPMDDLIGIRERVAQGVVHGLTPDLIVVDRHPFGVDGELRDALLQTRRARPGTTIVLGLREVLDGPETAALEWAALGDLTRVTEIFDEIWVYGDPAVHDVRSTGELPAELHGLVRHTGYLAADRHWLPEAQPTEQPYVLTMVGGGSDGHALAHAAARATVPHGHHHLVVAGPQMPARDLADIRAVAAAGTTVIASVPDGLATIRRASAIVSMAGYNTVCEVMSTTTPALLVPRHAPRLEQLIRARALAAVRAVDVLDPGDLTPARLTEWIAGAVSRTQDRTAVDLAGLAGVARRVDALTIAATHEEPTRVAV
ncbi:glycosyltransferase family protein [Knoellia sp. CPCC 206435]|uniref:glycosyltransferase family protein n=1 Tax=Knoellia terrae TaxID=3404797 RepID=UPI003B43C9A2